MNKKGQSISINTIIVAAIGLAVLVVLFLIFTGRLGSFTKGVGETASCDNSCRALGLSYDQDDNKFDCDQRKGTFVGGAYSDVTIPNGVCCCKPQ